MPAGVAVLSYLCTWPALASLPDPSPALFSAVLKVKEVGVERRGHPPTPSPALAEQMAGPLFLWCLLEAALSTSYLVHISVSAFQKSKHGNLHIYSRGCAGWWGKPSGNGDGLPFPLWRGHVCCPCQTRGLSDSPKAKSMSKDPFLSPWVFEWLWDRVGGRGISPASSDAQLDFSWDERAGIVSKESIVRGKPVLLVTVCLEEVLKNKNLCWSVGVNKELVTCGLQLCDRHSRTFCVQPPSL